MNVRCRFPRWDRERLTEEAEVHADRVSEFTRDEHDRRSSNTLIVNMLRHEFTDYDNDQSAQRFADACRAIAERYPWLSAECGRQLERRTRIDRENDEAAREYAEERDRWRRERVVESSAAIGLFHPGMHVRAKVRGHLRDAVVETVGRTRVRVRFYVPSAKTERVAQVYARDVEPIQTATTEESA